MKMGESILKAILPKSNSNSKYSADKVMIKLFKWIGKKVKGLWSNKGKVKSKLWEHMNR